MKNSNLRICVYPKDVMCLTGKSYSTSLRLVREIKKAYRKTGSTTITYAEFSAYMNMEPQMVLAILNGL